MKHVRTLLLAVACAASICAQVPLPGGGNGGGGDGSKHVIKVNGSSQTERATLDHKPGLCQAITAVDNAGGGATELTWGFDDSDPACGTYQRGTTLPATCNAGETFFDTDAAAGQNWYGCTATNTWTLLGGAPTYSGALTSWDGGVTYRDKNNVILNPPWTTGWTVVSGTPTSANGFRIYKATAPASVSGSATTSDNRTDLCAAPCSLTLSLGVSGLSRLSDAQLGFTITAHNEPSSGGYNFQILTSYNSDVTQKKSATFQTDSAGVFTGSYNQGSVSCSEDFYLRIDLTTTALTFQVSCDGYNFNDTVPSRTVTFATLGGTPTKLRINVTATAGAGPSESTVLATLRGYRVN
jgi:hypothetical protein